MRDRAERQILSALREGRREAYEAVVDTHYGSVYRFLLFLTREASLAEDLTQEVFAAAWGSLDRFEGRGSIKTWLHRIAYNRFVDAQRQQGRHAARVEKLGQQPAEAVRDPVSESMATEDTARLRKALEELAVEDRAPLVLHYIEGLSYREMAGVLDQPSGTVKWLTRRALTRLRHQLTERSNHE
ncbi:MAG: RNA polymerase sigma factor [Phycisphaerales bacterium]|nr:MAG: RNA polymerase sigma factor [Phycisphaerales bacterium]